MGFQSKGILYYQLGAVGWSESYWLKSGGYTSAQTDLDDLNTARMALMCDNVTCLAGVIYDVGDPRVRESLGFEPTTPVGTYTATGITSYDPDISIPVRMTDSTFHHAIRWERSPPSEVVVPPARYTPTAAWLAAIGVFHPLIASKCFMRVKSRPGPGFDFNTISAVTTVDRVAFRKSGRPFGLRRGRRIAG